MSGKSELVARERCGGKPGKPFVVMGILKMDPCPGCVDCADISDGERDELLGQMSEMSSAEHNPLEMLCERCGGVGEVDEDEQGWVPCPACDGPAPEKPEGGYRVHVCERNPLEMLAMMRQFVEDNPPEESWRQIQESMHPEQLLEDAIAGYFSGGYPVGLVEDRAKAEEVLVAAAERALARKEEAE